MHARLYDAALQSNAGAVMIHQCLGRATESQRKAVGAVVRIRTEAWKTTELWCVCNVKLA